MTSRAFAEKPLMYERQVGGDVVRVALQLLEVELARVVEGRPAGAEEHLLDGPLGMLRRLQLGVLGQHLGLGLVEHAVEAAEDRQRQDDLAVVRLLVVPRRRSAIDQRKLASSEKLEKVRPADAAGEWFPFMVVIAPLGGDGAMTYRRGAGSSRVAAQRRH